MTLLSIQHFSQSLGKKKILSDITFSAAASNITVILGPNGAGKTTLLKSIIGLLPTPHAEPNLNQIFFNEQIINQHPIYERVQQGLIYLPQQSSVFHSLTVQQNLDAVFDYHPYWADKTKKAFSDISEHWLTATNLTGTNSQKASTLSGGQKRKLEIVRALLMQPKMLLLDEPFAGVDPKSIYELKTIFINLASQGVGLVISDHHVDQLLSIAHYIYVVIGGKIISSGGIKEILENAHTKESYLGNQFFDEISKRFLKN